MVVFADVLWCRHEIRNGVLETAEGRTKEWGHTLEDEVLFSPFLFLVSLKILLD